MTRLRPLAAQAAVLGTAALVLLIGANVWSPVDAAQGARSRLRDWPAITREMKPWTRWWWHGSAVEPASLTAQLEALKAAGIGGVEVTPIYGVRGGEDRFIPYLSEPWMAVLTHTLREAGRLDVGVDMATGTGWPFGGPWVDDTMSPRSLVHKSWPVSGGERLQERVTLRQTPMLRAIGNPAQGANQGGGRGGGRGLQLADIADPVSANKDLQALAIEQVKYPRDLPLAALVASSDSGQVVDLTARVGRDGVLDWVAPAGRWTVDAIFIGWHGKLVERAAPGGEGNVIDHFSREAIRRYLARFDGAFAGRELSGLRGYFNDSYEVDDASGQGDWTPALFDEFQKRRGYDLRRHLPALLGRDTADANARVLADYRETVSDLLLDTFTTEWRDWARRQRRIVRNQAHGSPASLLDLYGASDIPETEGAEIQRFKWATSAAHVAGRTLVAAEAATWLGEHFRSTLADVRAAVDGFFVAGVNHIVYHGTAYSPVDDPWPGWQFYASVEFNPQNAWWDDFGALNAYVARTQSFLQSGKPDHDVLLYYPIYDALATRGTARLTHFGGANPPAQGTAFEDAAATLQSGGYTYDYVSDRQLAKTRVQAGRLTTEGRTSYRVVVLPPSKFIPLETFEQVLALARSGATVLSPGGWPADVAGLANLPSRRDRFRTAAASVTFGSAGPDGVLEGRLGRGRILRGADLRVLLTRAGVLRERMVDGGLHFARRADALGRFYFISNPGARAVDGWVPLASSTPGWQLFDPMSGRRGGARVRGTASGEREIYMQIPPGGSLIVAAGPSASTTPFEIYQPAGEPVAVGDQWALQFVKGGPRLPPARNLERLGSWTTLGTDAEHFSGTATYRTSFARPAAAATGWQLDLGVVRESARVRLNGRDISTLIGPPYRVVIESSLLSASNVLEVSVTNLTANRIRELDQRGVAWKKFYNVNFPARLGENRGRDGLFSAAGWTPLESGLIGPVTLTPVAALR